MSQLKRINSLKELQELARELGVRADWHEPDEQGLTARVYGRNFDNAGFWGIDHLTVTTDRNLKSMYVPTDTEVEDTVPEDPERFCEIFVVLYKMDENTRRLKAVGEVNLATLLAIACRTTE